MLAHTQENPYQCSLCDRLFIKNIDLTKHIYKEFLAVPNQYCFWLLEASSIRGKYGCDLKHYMGSNIVPIYGLLLDKWFY